MLTFFTVRASCTAAIPTPPRIKYLKLKPFSFLFYSLYIAYIVLYCFTPTSFKKPCLWIEDSPAMLTFFTVHASCTAAIPTPPRIKYLKLKPFSFLFYSLYIAYIVLYCFTPTSFKKPCLWIEDSPAILTFFTVRASCTAAIPKPPRIKYFKLKPFSFLFYSLYIAYIVLYCFTPTSFKKPCLWIEDSPALLTFFTVRACWTAAIRTPPRIKYLKLKPFSFLFYSLYIAYIVLYCFTPTSFKKPCLWIENSPAMLTSFTVRASCTAAIPTPPRI